MVNILMNYFMSRIVFKLLHNYRFSSDYSFKLVNHSSNYRQSQMKIRIFVLFTFLSAASILPQAINQDKNNSQVDLSSLKTSVLFNIHNGIKTLEAPLHFQSDDLVNAGIVIGATSIALALDNTVRNNVKSLHSKSADKWVSYGQYYGRAHYFVLGGGLMYLGGFLIGNKDIEETGGMLSQALFVTGVYTVAMKVILGRSRPFENEGTLSVEGFKWHYSDNSLPSGHTSTAFTISTILAKKIDNTYASILLYGLAGATAFQRVYSDKHWFSDTVLGAALGYFIGSKVYELNTGKDDTDSKSSLSINAAYVPSGVGLSLNFSF